MIVTSGFGKNGLHIVIDPKCKHCGSENMVLIDREKVILKCKDCGEHTSYEVK